MQCGKISAVLLLLLLVLLIASCSGSPKASNLIVGVDEASLVRIPEEEAVAFYELSSSGMHVLAEYLLDNEIQFGTRPVVLSKDNYAELLTEKTIRDIVDVYLSEGHFISISSLNDDPDKSVRFVVGKEQDVYEQGIFYTSDGDIDKNDPTVYNDVKRYVKLDDGWYYYVYHYDSVKDAEKYRKQIWDRFDEKTRASITTDWNKALVTLKDRNGKLVVSVCFHTEQDGLLGPITVYIDPVTGEFLGGEPRM